MKLFFMILPKLCFDNTFFFLRFCQKNFFTFLTKNFFFWPNFFLFGKTLFGELHLVKLHLANFIWQSFIWRRLATPIDSLASPGFSYGWTDRQTYIHKHAQLYYRLIKTYTIIYFDKGNINDVLLININYK